jgi:hypothetical protein
MATTDQSVTTNSPDRIGRLMVAGMILVLLGCLLFFVVAMMGAMLAANAHAKGSPFGESSPGILVKALVLDVLIAVALIWVGIGLGTARRWAWTLTVAWSWVWIAMGAVSIVYVILTIPATQAAVAEKAGLPPGFTTLMSIVPILISAGLYFVLPAALLVLCQQESVRATCERRDPKLRWTDRCPLPVLAVSLMFAFSVSSLFSLATCLPVFGLYITGAAAVTAAVLIAGVFAWLAWGTYRLQPAAWWGALVVAVVGMADAVFTFAAMDVAVMYKEMGMSAEMVEAMQKAGLFATFSRYGPWLSLASGIGSLGYLIYLRRYFFRTPTPTP